MLSSEDDYSDKEHKWRVALLDILFKEGTIVEHGEEAEEAEHQEG